MPCWQPPGAETVSPSPLTHAPPDGREKTSLDRTRGSLPPTPKPDPHSILQDLVSHFPFSGSPCVGLSSKNAPFLLTQAAPACPLHPASGASKLNLSCSYQKPCPGVCAERHFPPLCCKLCRVWISLSLLLGPPLLSSLLLEFVFRRTVSPHPLNLPPAGRLFCYTQANTARPPICREFQSNIRIWAVQFVVGTQASCGCNSLGSNLRERERERVCVCVCRGTRVCFIGLRL